VARTGRSDGRSHSSEWLFCLSFCLLLALAPAGCGSGGSDTVKLTGATMGTTWSLVYVPAEGLPGEESVHSGVQAVLDAIEASMSTYREDSEISRLNRADPGTWFQLSADMMRVLMTAIRVGAASGGAYDITVGPLVALWGFGPGERIAQPPAAEAIAARLSQVGQDRLSFNLHGGSVLKRRQLAVDLSSLAKGYAVDRAAQWLAQNGIDRFLLEVGGEMKLAGLSGRGDPWRIAIERPESGGRVVARTLALTDAAIATSGDYRNFFEYQGRRYSHTLDPRTGWPVEHDLISVTVVHDSAMLADAWATALGVLGGDRGMAVAQEQGLAVYFIRRTGDALEHSHSPAFGPYLAPSAAVSGPGANGGPEARP